MKKACSILMLMVILASCTKEMGQINKRNENQPKQYNPPTLLFDTGGENRGTMNPPPPPPPPPNG